MCLRGRDLDGTARSLRGVESEKEELSTLTMKLQKSIEVRWQKLNFVFKKTKKSILNLKESENETIFTVTVLNVETNVT